MATMSDRLRTASSTNKWSVRAENFRKTPTSPPNNTWPSETLAQLRYANSVIYPHDSDSDHDPKPPEPKTSEESLDVDTAECPRFQMCYPYVGELKITEQPPHDVFQYEYPKPNTSYQNEYASATHSPLLRQMGSQQSHRTLPGTLKHAAGINVEQAVVAMQNLQKLKELQRKRDLTERYYSQEIRKLIGDHYTTIESVADARKDEKQTSSPAPTSELCSGEQVKSTGQVMKALEPCGTMTTITRLDCGCVQETTRPIFTTSRGKVQKRNCHHRQDQMTLKLTSSNPQEYLCSTAEATSKAPQDPPRPRRRPRMDFVKASADRKPNRAPKFCNVLGQNESVSQSVVRKLDSANASRTNIPQMRSQSPLQKFSDSSIDSAETRA